LRSLIKYPARNIIYALLLITAFTTINLLINTYFTGQNLIRPFNEFSKSFTSFEDAFSHRELFSIQDAIQSSISSLIFVAVLLILLCALILPFLQYLFSIGRGYEIGVLRALGMSKGRAWLKLFIENILLSIAALITTQIITLLIHKRFSLSLLAIDSEAKDVMIKAFGDISELITFNWSATYFAFGLVIIITIITAGLSNILISNNAPLKLIRNFK